MNQPDPYQAANDKIKGNGAELVSWIGGCNAYNVGIGVGQTLMCGVSDADSQNALKRLLAQIEGIQTGDAAKLNVRVLK